MSRHRKRKAMAAASKYASTASILPHKRIAQNCIATAPMVMATCAINLLRDSGRHWRPYLYRLTSIIIGDKRRTHGIDRLGGDEIKRAAIGQQYGGICSSVYERPPNILRLAQHLSPAAPYMLLVAAAWPSAPLVRVAVAH